jgi:hypothetical protein
MSMSLFGLVAAVAYHNVRMLHGRYCCFVNIVNAGSTHIYCSGMGDRQSVVGGLGKVCKDDRNFLTGDCVVRCKLPVADASYDKESVKRMLKLPASLERNPK